jgi:serine/threonine protein kinase
MEQPDASWAGREIAGRFRLIEVLGEGGIAVVFRAEDVELKRIVAVKILNTVGQGHSELRGRFEREARALAALSHPNIVSLVDYGVEDGRAYLVMELLKGQTLGDLFDREGTLPPERAFHILRQVCRALQYAHGEGLLHRDLKPDNVFLQALPDTPDHVRLLDFGFAKFVGDESRDGPALTQAGTVFGTPRYMAPEQLTGGSVDPRVDLYAVAVMLFEALAGRRPFEGEVRDVLRAKVVEDPPTLASVAPELEIAPALEALFAKALATDKAHRHPDIATFLEALDAIPQPAVRPKPATPPPKPRSSAMPWVLIGALAAIPFALLVLAGCAGALFYLLRGDAPPEPVVVPEPAPLPSIDPSLIEESILPTPDPWTSAGSLPPVLADVKRAIDAGEPIPHDTFRTLREHAAAHPDEALAQLLLGHVFTERGMRAMAVGAYENAWRIDPGARGDPRMCVNLVVMSAEPNVGPGPSRLLREAYGAEAIPVIDNTLASRDLDTRRAQRLTDLRAELE